MENEFNYEEEFNPKRIIITCIIIGIIVVGVFIYFYISHKNNTLSIKKTVTYEAGTTINTSVDYFVKSKIIDIDDYTLDLSNVDTSKVGNYTYTVKYKNITKSGTIKIVDKTNPNVEVVDLTVGVGEEIVLDEFISSCDDYSKPCSVSFENENDQNDSNKEGTYSFNIIVSDSQNNKVTKKVNLIVKSGYDKQNNIINDLNISYISPEFDDYNNTFTVKYDKAISDDEIFGDENFSIIQDMIASDLHAYIPSLYNNNLITNTDIIYIYNKYGYIIGYSIRLKLDNGLVFYLEK